MDFELIIWDDASTDDSWEIIQSYADPRIRAFRNETNRYAVYGLNKAISEEARGKYIAIHHSDDAWEPNKLEEQVGFLDTHPEIGAVFTNAMIVAEKGEPFEDKSNYISSVFDQPNRSRHEWLNYFFYHGNALCHPSILIRKICYQECGLYRQGLVQISDFDMWVRLCLKYEIHVMPKKLVRFRIRDDKANNSSTRTDNNIRNQFEFIPVLDHYCHISNYIEMVKIFPTAQKYYRSEGFDAQFVLAMIALETKPYKFTELFGLRLLFDELNNPSKARKIKKLYNFDINNFKELSGTHDIFSFFINAQLAETQAELAWKDLTVQALAAQVAEINRSKAWRIALLFRRIRVLLAPSNSHRARVLRRLINGIFFPFRKIRRNREIKEDLDLIMSSGLFDEDWYLNNNPDVPEAKVDPLLHFLQFGGFEGRSPGPNFSSAWYLDTHADIKNSGINPLVHFLKYGRLEKRKPLPTQDIKQFLTDGVETRQNAQVLTLSLPPLDDAYSSSRQSRTGKLLFNIRNLVHLFGGVLHKSSWDKALYILKNYGLGSLIKRIDIKLKVILSGGDNNSIHSITNTKPKPRSSSPNKVEENKINAKLQVFLSSDASLELPIYTEPVVSIILLFYNRAAMSLQCLETLALGAGSIPFEVVIIDNASTDETSELLERVNNAKIIRNPANLGFGGGCNQAVDLAIGKYLLFLNNDIELLSNSIKIMVDTIENGTNIGAVGGKLIFPDGRLQEAGSIIWRDGSCEGYGRYDDPFKPEFSYVKEVDYCSGALLLTPRLIFLSLGKFDTRYAPAYYEDNDYCVHLWSKGFRVVFQPFAVGIHYEFGSSGKASAIALQKKNQDKFIRKWQNILEDFNLPIPANIFPSREHKSNAKRILFIDDQIPDYRIGSGYPRSYQIIQILAEAGYRLTFLPLQKPANIPEISRLLQLKGVEILYSEGTQKIDLEALLRSRPNYYDIAFISRPHNMKEAMKHLITLAKKTRVIYDAEAIFSLREIKYNDLNGNHMNDSEKERLIQNEVSLTIGASIVTTVTEKEKDIFVKYGAASVHVLGNVIDPKPTPATFEERRGILFVGGVLGYPSPNEDAVHYFVNQIFPLVRQSVECEFYIVGTNNVKAIWDMESNYVHVIGKVEDLTPYYNRCRLFVVPTRYSAGIPLKMIEAAAYGLPAVVTPLTAEQLGWREDRDILVGHDHIDFGRKVVKLYSNPDIFYSLRQNALDRIREEYNQEKFRSNLEHILAIAIDKGKGLQNG
jgi:GT2 family glycosyltransferase